MNVYLPDVIWVRLQINKLTQSLKQSYILMIHANGIMYFNYQIGFASGSTVQLKIKKKDLGNGIFMRPFLMRTLHLSPNVCSIIKTDRQVAKFHWKQKHWLMTLLN